MKRIYLTVQDNCLIGIRYLFAFEKNALKEISPVRSPNEFRPAHLFCVDNKITLYACLQACYDNAFSC